jgi:hypothetical protein
MERSERRHSRRVTVDGFVFDADGSSRPVIDLSLGGMRIGLTEGAARLQPGDSLAGRLIGNIESPIELQAIVSWVDPENKTAGLAFNVMGHSVVDRLLKAMIPE